MKDNFIRFINSCAYRFNDGLHKIKKGEGQTIEFKSTLRINLHTMKPDKDIEFAVLKTIAGFRYVTNPLPMKNSNNAVVYYLFLASQASVAVKVGEYIFNKYRDKM